MVIHEQLPIADGIWFDDLRWLEHRAKAHAAVTLMLTGRGLVWATTFRDPDTDKVYGGLIIAGSKPQAEEVALGRGLEETIVGQLVARIEDRGTGEDDDQ